MKNINKTLIIIFAVILICVSIFSILVSFIFFIIGRNIIAYTIIIASLIFIVNSAILLVKKNYRVFFIIFSSVTILSSVIILSDAIYNNYEKNIKTVDNYLLLKSYYPFDDIRNDNNSKVSKLTNKSSLIITNNFPRLDGATALFPVYSSFANACYKLTVTNNEFTNMFLENIPFARYIITNDNGEARTNYGRATNGYYDTAYVLCSKTHNAYINLIYDKADLIFCAAPSDEEIEEAKANYREFILTAIGKEAFVFFVNSKNKIDNLSRENLKDIYTGKINNWKELGGSASKIKAYQRNKNSGSQNRFIKFMVSMNAENDITTPLYRKEIATMNGIIDAVAEYKNKKNAIGYSFLFYTLEMIGNNEIKDIIN